MLIHCYIARSTSCGIDLWVNKYSSVFREVNTMCFLIEFHDKVVNKVNILDRA